MHRSRIAGLSIDCKTDDLEAAADFWSAALGYSRKGKSEDADSTRRKTSRMLKSKRWITRAGCIWISKQTISKPR